MSKSIDAISFASASPSPLDLLALQIEQDRLDDAAKSEARLPKSLSDYQHALRHPAEDEKKEDEETMTVVKSLPR